MKDNTPTDNRQFRIYEKTGNYARFTVEEVIASNLNHWKGWHCSAGDRGLYIDYDGNVWVANCASSNKNKTNHSGTWESYVAYRKKSQQQDWEDYRTKHIGEYPHIEWIQDNTRDGWPMPKVEWETCEQHKTLMKYVSTLEDEFDFNWDYDGWYKDFVKDEDGFIWKSRPDDKESTWGLLGSIFNGWETPHKWTRCPYNSCGCGADVILSKVKDSKYKAQLHVTQDGFTGQHESQDLYIANIETPTAVEMNFPINYQILWDLSRRCNHNCSYCWPSVHNTSDPWHSIDDVMSTIDTAIEWSDGEQIRWNFGGGEPTIYPKFIEILKYLKSQGHWTMVTTNGSRSSRWWKDASAYINTVNFSCHFEEVNIEKFIGNIQVVCQHHDTVNDDHWIEIKLMAPAGMVGEASQMKRRIEALPEWNTPGANNRQKGAIAIVPIRTIEDAGVMSSDYTSIELEMLQEQ